MSIIGIKGVPWKWALKAVAKTLKRVINGPFDAVNFEPGRVTFKICYLRLSERLDPIQVVENINRAAISAGVGLKLTAFIPKYIPDIPLATKASKHFIRSNPDIPVVSPQKVMKYTHEELLVELQSRFPGLFNLSRKTGHKLMDEIARTIFGRLKHIKDMSKNACKSSVQLSQAYRSTHPHFGDFQLILSTLHRLQDAAGAPRAQLQESELAALPTQPLATDVPYEQLQATRKKYSERITKKILEHMDSYKTDVSQLEGEEEIARRRVREELGKLSPFMSMIVKQVISNHFAPQKADYIRVRIYGEPFLPGKDSIKPLVERYLEAPQKILRSQKMYNMITFCVMPKNLQSLLAMDGTVVNEAKLVIRLTDMPRYDTPAPLMKELMATCGFNETGVAVSN